MSKLYNTFFKDAKSINLRSSYFIELFKNSKDLDCTAIAIDGKEKIQVGDKVPVTIQTSLETPYTTYYVANKIYSELKSAIINEFEETDTTLFILPFLEVDAKLLLIKANFVNGYIASRSSYSEIGDCVYIMYRYMPFNQYRRLIDILSEHPNFISISKSEDKRFDIVQMSIPERFKDSTRLIFEGKYSEVPKHIKHTIVKFQHRKKDDIIYQTLFNGKELKETMAYNLGIKVSDLPAELREKPNIIKEILI